MGVITRSEAEHRLRILSSAINGAINDVRSGNWRNAAAALKYVDKQGYALTQEIADALRAEEVSRTPDNSSAAPPVLPFKRLRGGEVRGDPPRKQTGHPKRHKGTDRVFSMGPAETPGAQAPEKTEVTFDLVRIQGTPEFNVRPMGTQADHEASRVWEGLRPELRDEISRRYRTSGKPVTVRLNPVELKWGVRNS